MQARVVLAAAAILLSATPWVLGFGGGNHPPLAQSQYIAFDVNQPAQLFAITLTATDPDGDPLSYFIPIDAWLPDHGFLTSADGSTVTASFSTPLTSPNLWYHVNSVEFSGQDTIFFFVRDSYGVNSNIGLITLTINSPTSDPDGDGLTNLEEYQYHTNRFDPDTDHDGLPDGLEVHTYQSSPLRADTDNDLLDDLFEITHVYPTGLKTSLIMADSDGDGVNDGLEVFGLYSLDGAATDPTNPDTDGDGIPDGIDTHPLVNDDVDGDGYPDECELYYWGNLDHLPNVDEDGDGYTNLQECYNGTLPNAPLPVWPNSDQYLAVIFANQAAALSYGGYTQHAAESPYALVGINNAGLYQFYASMNPAYQWSMQDAVTAFTQLVNWYASYHPGPDFLKTYLSGGDCMVGYTGLDPAVTWPDPAYPRGFIPCDLLPPEHYFGASSFEGGFVQHQVNIQNPNVASAFVQALTNELLSNGVQAVHLDNIRMPESGGTPNGSNCSSALPPGMPCPNWSFEDVTNYLNLLRDRLNSDGILVQVNAALSPVSLAQNNFYKLGLLKDATNGLSIEASFFDRLPAGAATEAEVYRQYMSDGAHEVLLFPFHPAWSATQGEARARLYGVLAMLLREPGQAFFTVRSFFTPPSEYDWAAWPQYFGAPTGPFTVLDSPTSGRFQRSYQNGLIFASLAQITTTMHYVFHLPSTPLTWTLRRAPVASVNLPPSGWGGTALNYQPPAGFLGSDSFIYGALCDGPPPSLNCHALAAFGIRVNGPIAQPFCGDGNLNPPEQCDFINGVGVNLGEFGDGVGQCSAYSAQYTSGNLSCNSNCTINTSGCH